MMIPPAEEHHQLAVRLLSILQQLMDAEVLIEEMYGEEHPLVDPIIEAREPLQHARRALDDTYRAEHPGTFDPKMYFMHGRPESASG